MTEQRVSVPTRLVELARTRWRFATTHGGIAVAIDLADDEAVLRIETQPFRAVLAAILADDIGTVPSQAQLRDATTVLVGLADAERIDSPFPDPILVIPEEDPREDFSDVPDEPGDELLDDVRAFTTKYVAFSSPAAADALTLWLAHTHAVDAFESTPRIAMLSPEKQSAKTRTLEVAELLVRRPRRCTSMSPAYMFRIIDEECPTLLLDECDSIWGHTKTGDTNEDLRALINSGHRRGATVGRIVGEGKEMRPRDFPSYCPVALAGIGNLPETIADRAVILRMRRRAPHERVAAFRWRTARSEAEPLQRRLAAWGSRRLDDLGRAEPAMPAGVTDRPADVWEPLVAIADAAGAHWPETARAAALELIGRADDASINVTLLAAVRDTFEELCAERIPTTVLIARLHDDEAQPWATWNEGRGVNAADLARRLKGFGIGPHKYRLAPGDPRPEGFAGETTRGYAAEHFADAFARYLPPPPSGDGTAGTPEHGTEPAAVPVPEAPEHAHVPAPSPLQPFSHNGRSTVPHVPANTGEREGHARTCSATPDPDPEWADRLREQITYDDAHRPLTDDELLR